MIVLDHILMENENKKHPFLRKTPMSGKHTLSIFFFDTGG